MQYLHPHYKLIALHLQNPASVIAAVSHQTTLELQLAWLLITSPMQNGRQEIEMVFCLES